MMGVIYVFTLSEMFMVIFIRQEARCNGKLVQAMSSQCYDVGTGVGKCW